MLPIFIYLYYWHLVLTKNQHTLFILYMQVLLNSCHAISANYYQQKIKSLFIKKLLRIFFISPYFSPTGKVSVPQYAFCQSKIIF